MTFTPSTCTAALYIHYVLGMSADFDYILVDEQV